MQLERRREGGEKGCFPVTFGSGPHPQPHPGCLPEGVLWARPQTLPC